MNEHDKKELIDYRLKKARETLNEVNELVKLQFWNSAVNRLYYACFYALNGLMLKHDIETKTHDGLRRMFGLHFIKNGIIPKEFGRFFSDLFDKRQTGDYDDFIEFDKEIVNDLLIPANDLINLIERLINDKKLPNA